MQWQARRKQILIGQAAKTAAQSVPPKFNKKCGQIKHHLGRCFGKLKAFVG